MVVNEEKVRGWVTVIANWAPTDLRDMKKIAELEYFLEFKTRKPCVVCTRSRRERRSRGKKKCLGSDDGNGLRVQ